ncbi:propanediol dehydratase, partial [Mycobacterium sp. ITM-2017-0098]
RGDQLQTSAIFDEKFRVLSKLTDPNDYSGPATGYAPTAQRRAEIDAIRQARTSSELTADQLEHRGHVVVTDVEPAR